MKKDIERYELIEHYLNGTCSEAEIDALETLAQNNPTVRSEIEQHRQLHAIIEEKTMLEFSQRLESIHKQHTRRKLTNKLRNGGILSGILGVLIASVLVFSERNEENKPSTPIDSTAIIQADIHQMEQVATQPKVPQDNPPDETITTMHHPEEAVARKNNTSEKVINDTTRYPVSDSISEKKVLPIEDTPEPRKLTIEETEIVPIQVTNTPKHEVNCDTVYIRAQYQVVEGCSNKPSGEIAFQTASLEGGTPPYQYSIDNGNEYYESACFIDLYSGHYSLWIKDFHQCESQIDEFYLESHDCSYQEIFAPLEDETWKVPTNNRAALLRIYSQQGTLVFQQNIEEGITFQWDGNSFDGNRLRMGVYGFTLQFDEQDILTGSITIVR